VLVKIFEGIKEMSVFKGVYQFAVLFRLLIYMWFPMFFYFLYSKREPVTFLGWFFLSLIQQTGALVEDQEG
jgi:hypothetical protein